MRFLILLSFLLSGCSLLQQTPTSSIPSPAPTTTFKYDLSIDVNGTSFAGVAVVPRSESYKITIKSDVDVDYLTIDSCHRDFVAQGAITQDWWQPRKSYVYNFIPNHGIEDQGSCLVRVGAYNNGGKPNAWALIDFETPEATLSALQKCNGVSSSTNGASICQSRTGLVQQISFQGPVMISDLVEAKCKPTSKDNISWDYVIPEGECVVDFMEKAKPHRVHRHSFVGYSTVQVRSN